MAAKTDLHRLCRLCGKEDPFKVQIFGSEGAARHLKKKIETCLPFEVTECDSMPSSLCYRCLHQLETYYDFHIACVTANASLHAVADLSISSPESKGVTTDDAVLESKPAESNLNNILRRVLTSTPREPITKTTDESNWLSEIAVRKRERDIESSRRKGKPRKIPKLDKSDHMPFDKCPSAEQAQQVDDDVEYEEDSAEENEDSENDLAPLEPLLEIYEEEEPATDELITKDSVPDLYNKVARNYSLTYNCEFCNFTLPSKWDRWLHISSTHASSQPALVCTMQHCRKVFISESFRKDHETHHEVQGEYPNSCEVCAKLWNSRMDFYKHLMGVHPQAAALTCGQCLKILPSVQDLQAHVLAMHKYFKGDGFSCSICARTYTSKAKMLRHKSVHGFSNNESVGLGPKVRLATKSADLQVVEKCNQSCTPTTAYQVIGRSNWSSCPDCNDLTFSTFSEFSSHARTIHSVFHCDLCLKSYGRNSHLWKHVNRLHKGHELVTCALCHVTSASRYHLQQHINKLHNKVDGYANLPPAPVPSVPVAAESEESNVSDTETEAPPILASEDASLRVAPSPEPEKNIYQTLLLSQRSNHQKYAPAVMGGAHKCLKCYKTFHKKYYLKQHRKTCRPKTQNELLTRCKACERVFKDRLSLSKHLENYHSNYKCHLCPGVEYASKLEIINHNRFTHPGHKELICPYRSCAAGILRSPLELAKHQIDHQTMPVQAVQICQFCGDTLTSKIKLKMHILSLHRKILTLSCGVCLKLHGSQHDLMRHVESEHRQDIKTNNFCRVCGKSYGSKWKTYDHIVKSHGSEFTVCKMCLSVFDSDVQLSDHVKAIHFKVAPSTRGQQPAPNETSVFFGQGHSLGESLLQMQHASDARHMKKIADGKSAQSDHSYSSDIEEIACDSDGEVRSTETARVPPIRLQNSRVHPENYTIVSSAAEATRKEINSRQSPLQNSSKRKVYENDGPSECASCHKVWPAKKHLWQHYIRCHKRMAATTCGICLQVCPNYDTLRLHLNKFHTHLLYGCGFGSNFICKICGRYHNASSKLSLHMVIHENVSYSEDVSKISDSHKDKADAAAIVESLDHFIASSIVKDEILEEDSNNPIQNNDLENVKEEVLDIKDASPIPPTHFDSDTIESIEFRGFDSSERITTLGSEFLQNLHKQLDSELRSDTDIGDSDSECYDDYVNGDQSKLDIDNEEDEQHSDQEECNKLNPKLEFYEPAPEDDTQASITVTPIEFEQIIRIKHEEQDDSSIDDCLDKNGDIVSRSDEEIQTREVDIEQMLANMLGENGSVDKPTHQLKFEVDTSEQDAAIESIL